MPFCKKTKTLFIHIPKTAGTSIEKSLGIYGINNTEGSRTKRSDTLFGGAMQHFTAVEAVAHLSTHKLPYDLHRSFSVLRDPIGRFISHYRWTPAGEKSGRDLEQFFVEIFFPSLGDQGNEARHRWPQFCFLSDIDNQMMVRYLINFVHLEQGYAQVAQKLGLPLEELPHLKRGNTSDDGSRTPQIPGFIRYFLKGFYHADSELLKTFEKDAPSFENRSIPMPKLERLEQLPQMVRDRAISTALKAMQKGMPHQPFAYGLASLFYKSGDLREAKRHLLVVQNEKLTRRVQIFRCLLSFFTLTRAHRIPTIDRKMRKFIRIDRTGPLYRIMRPYRGR
jgi:hypothetical protein